jgi:tetratricopeptide (TPR) repeat protein
MPHFMGDKEMNRLTRALIILGAVLTCATIAAAQSARVTGQVLDYDGKPWPDVTVVLKSDNGRTFTLKTDKNGEFSQIGLSVGVYTVTLSNQSGNANYVTQQPISGSAENSININFKALKEQGKVGPDPEAVKRQQEQQNLFKEMQTHFVAGRTAMEDWDAVHKQLSTTPADQKGALQEKLAADAKTAISEFQLAEQGVQTKDVKNHAVVWSNLAQAYDRANQTKEAVDAYQKAIDLQPAPSYYISQGTALANLAVAQTDPQVAQEKLANASADCDKAAALDPTPGAAKSCWKNIGIILSNKGDLKNAIAPLVKATTADPKDAQAWFLLGSAYTGTIDSKQEGDKMTYIIPPGTSDAYQKCVDADPNGPYAAQCKNMIDTLATMAGGDATSVGVRKKKKS